MKEKRGKCSRTSGTIHQLSFNKCRKINGRSLVVHLLVYYIKSEGIKGCSQMASVSSYETAKSCSNSVYCDQARSQNCSSKVSRQQRPANSFFQLSSYISFSVIFSISFQQTIVGYIFCLSLSLSPSFSVLVSHFLSVL